MRETDVEDEDEGMLREIGPDRNAELCVWTGQRGYIIYTLNTVKEAVGSQEVIIMDESLKIQLDIACSQLRDMIRNEQQQRMNVEKWRSMANTSTIERRIKNEVNKVQTVLV